MSCSLIRDCVHTHEWPNLLACLCKIFGLGGDQTDVFNYKFLVVLFGDQKASVSHFNCGEKNTALYFVEWALGYVWEEKRSTFHIRIFFHIHLYDFYPSFEVLLLHNLLFCIQALAVTFAIWRGYIRSLRRQRLFTSKEILLVFVIDSQDAASDTSPHRKSIKQVIVGKLRFLPQAMMSCKMQWFVSFICLFSVRKVARLYSEWTPHSWVCL